jgi:hypothetical protein
MITINGIRWRVHLVPPSHPLLLTKKGNFDCGCCDNITKTIYISNNLDKTLTRKVLCHEITHAVMFSYKVKLTHKQEELVANLFSEYGDEILSLTNITYALI